MWTRGTFTRFFTSSTASLSNHEAHSSCFAGFALTLPPVVSAVWHDLDPECALGLPGHGNPDDVLNHENLDGVLNWATRTNRSHFQTRLQTFLFRSMETFWHGFRFHSFLAEIFFFSSCRRSLFQQPVFASPHDHQALEEALRTQVSIPYVNCYRTGQGRLWSVRYDHHWTFQQGRQVFLEIQDQASRYRAVLAQVRHLVVF